MLAIKNETECSPFGHKMQLVLFSGTSEYVVFNVETEHVPPLFARECVALVVTVQFP